ncbi:MAG: TfoX/Sxy family DNA transformation protein [bacterium]|nr:TfoX/Sxy family DNA transformation protein [bacterium]
MLMTQYDDFSTLKNIAKKTGQWLHDAGIHTIEDLFELGQLKRGSASKRCIPN